MLLGNKNASSYFKELFPSPKDDFAVVRMGRKWATLSEIDLEEKED